MSSIITSYTFYQQCLHEVYTADPLGLQPCRTTIEFAVVGDHEHDLPFKKIVFDQTATYARYVFVALHLLELATQEPGGC